MGEKKCEGGVQVFSKSATTPNGVLALVVAVGLIHNTQLAFGHLLLLWALEQNKQGKSGLTGIITTISPKKKALALDSDSDFQLGLQPEGL